MAASRPAPRPMTLHLDANQDDGEVKSVLQRIQSLKSGTASEKTGMSSKTSQPPVELDSCMVAMKDGLWIRHGKQAPPHAKRLVVVDKLVDPEGLLCRAFLEDVRVVMYDPAIISSRDWCNVVRDSLRANKRPFHSIAVANHGPEESTNFWQWTKDVTVNMQSGNTSKAINELSSFMEVMISSLEKTPMGVAHIDFLSCRLAAINVSFIAELEALYHVDFRASIDNTGKGVEFCIHMSMLLGNLKNS